MKLTFILLQVGAVFGQAIIDGRWNGPPGCDSNNCARAVTGTRLGSAVVSSHIADCLSYQQVTTYFDCDSVASPTATPTYASACTEEANAYGSACSCWGYPVVTQTVWPPPPPPPPPHGPPPHGPPPNGPPPNGPPPNGPPPNGPPPNGPPPNGPPPNGPPPNGPPPNGPPPKGGW